MAISEVAQRHHEALFPEHRSTLGITDPELIEIFDNWAFDEVLRDTVLDMPVRAMVQLAAIIGCNGIGEFRMMLGGALNIGVTPVQAKEIVYQAVPYVGMARVFDFIHVSNEVFSARGIVLPLPGQSTTTAQSRYDRGLVLQRELFGEAIDRQHAAAVEDQRPIQHWLTAHCFGDHLTRGALGIAMRELLTLSMLAALGGCEAQLGAHVAANLATGNDRRTMIDTITAILPYIGYPRALNALAVITRAT